MSPRVSYIIVKARGISHTHDMPLQLLEHYELFTDLGLDFVRFFPLSSALEILGLGQFVGHKLFELVYLFWIHQQRSWYFSSG
jgi:hypothetical protein